MRALSRNTRRVTALTLAAALVIAVYLNWQYARTGVTLEEDAVNVSAVSQETVPVTDELMTEAEAVSSANKNYGEAQLVSVANDAGAKFFEEARLKRQKAHDEAMDTIQKTLKTSGLSAEEKKGYTQQLTSNLEDLNAENEIETLVKAKGSPADVCSIFEGFMDFLSAATLGLETGDCLVLNSVANVEKAMRYLNGYGRIDCYLDRDEAGRRTLAILQEYYGRRVCDRSALYDGCKDLNEHLQLTTKKEQ